MKVKKSTQTFASAYSDAIATMNMAAEEVCYYSIQALVDVDTPAATTFDSGGAEYTTITFPAAAALTGGDYVTLTDAAGNSWGVYGDKTGATAAPTGAIYTAINAARKGAADLTEPAATTADAGVSETGTITFANFAGTTGADYVTIYDDTGAGWAIAADKTGADPAPTGAIWTGLAAGKKAQKDISAAVSAADVAALFVTAFNALVGFNAKITLTDNLDGTVTYAVVVRGPCTDAVPKNADDSGAGSIAVSAITGGVASEVDVAANTLAIPTHGYRTGLKVRISANVGAVPAGLAAGVDYYVIATSASLIKLADTRAHALSNTPLDITDQGTDGSVFTITVQALAAADVAYEFYKKFNALTGFTSVVTLTDNADGTVAAVNVSYGTATDSQYKNADDSGAGSITAAVTDQGNATEVSVANDTVTIPSHGYTTGLKGRLTTTGTLPAGVTTGVDYFIIVVDSDTVAFASSLADAQAGTKIDLTDFGADDSVNTFTPTALAGGTIKLQESNDGTTWADVSGSSQNITADANFWLSSALPRSEWVRAYITLTAGHITASVYLYCYNPYERG